jgi:hypothetical protein
MADLLPPIIGVLLIAVKLGISNDFIVKPGTITPLTWQGLAQSENKLSLFS